MSFGYGQLGFGNRRLGTFKNYRAHRVSWELHNGPVPAGLEVCHRCDNPPCTNPEHLFVGTHAANMHDKSLKGRQPKGRPVALAVQANPTLRSDNKSGYRGVHWDTARGRWFAKIKLHKQTALGRFDSVIDAAKAYDKAARDFYGPNAYQNFPANDNGTAA